MRVSFSLMGPPRLLLDIFAACCWLVLLPSQILRAEVMLTGVLQHGTEPAQNGRTAGSPIWNTVGNEVSFANIYLTQPNSGYTASFLNAGNGNGASISYALAPGTYQFYYFVMGFWDNNPGEYGLNLFFDGNNTDPGITAYSVAGTTSANAAGSGLPTLALDGSVVITPTPSDLTYIAGGLQITLTAYGFGLPGTFGGPELDRIGNLDSVPDLALDSVGHFTLQVTPIPEPSVLAFAAIAILLLVVSHPIRMHRSK